MNTEPRRETLNERLSPVKSSRVIRNYRRQSLGEDKQSSVETQKVECERLAYSLGITRAEWAAAHVYSDIDRSGGDFKGRAELRRLLEEAQPADIIIVWNMDRLGRDMIDVSATVRELVKYRGCLLYTTETGTTPVKMDSAEQTFLVAARGFGGQAKLETVRKDTRDGLRRRALEGFAAGRVGFGYKTVLVDPTVKERKLSKKRIEIDEPAAAVVRDIYKMYLAGRGYIGIAQHLNRIGAASPRGRGWSRACVWDMLREPRYIGEWTYGERRTVKREGRRVVQVRASESEIIRTSRPDLAIITADQWAQVQTAIVARTTNMRSRCNADRANHLLSKTLLCDACGRPMKVKVCKSRFTDWKRRYYVCTGHQLARCPVDVHLPADETEQRVTAEIQSDIFGRMEAMIHSRLDEAIRLATDASDARANDADNMREQLQDLRRERQRLVRLAAASDDPVSELLEALQSNQERAKALQGALDEATKPRIDTSTAERLRADAAAEAGRMRQQLDGPEARLALEALFPEGLRFKVGAGLWLIEGKPSVLHVNQSDKIRLPDATPPCRHGN